MKVTCFTSATTSCGLPTALISLLAACTGQGHRCIEHERTIEHGIYGEVVYRALGVRGEVTGDTPLYQVNVSLSEQTPGSALVATETNEDGLYEFALPKPQPQTLTDFTLASTFPNAPMENVEITDLKDLVRRDLVIEEGQLLWDGPPVGECAQ